MSKSRLKSTGHVAVSRSCEPEVTKQPSGGYIGWLLRSFIFFAFFYLYLWLYVDLKLIYHGAGIITNFPVFYKSWSFFLSFLPYPGGPVEYVSAFLSQLFYYSWAGALVITVQAWLMYLCLCYLFKAARLWGRYLICFILPILLLVAYTQYTYHFTTTMAFLTALLTSCIYLKTTRSSDKFLSFVVIFLLLSVILYYLAGGAFLLFAIICATYELFFRARWKVSLFYLLCAAAVPYVLGLLIFQVSIVSAFDNLLPFSWRILKYDARKRGVEIIYVLYLVTPLILLVFGILHMLGERLHFAQNKTKKKRRNKSSNPLLNIFSFCKNSPKLKWAAGSLLLFSIAGSAIFFSRNESLRTRFKVDYYAYHKMWPDLLITAQRNAADPFIANAVNRALYNVGRLGYDMFSWPQHKDYLFLSGKEHKWVDWQVFDLYLDIGLVGIAGAGRKKLFNN